MTAASRRARASLALVLALGVAILALVALDGLLPAPSRESAAPTPAPGRVRQGDLQAALDAATPALLARDRSAWDAALPATGAARRAMGALYRRLAPLPWTSLRLVAEPVSGRPGRFFVGAVGELGHAGPDDRIFARRVVDAELRDGRPVLRDDVTPAELRGQGVMAFDRPVVVRRHGLVVIAERRRRAGAEALADAGGPARRRLRLLGIRGGAPVVVWYYSSRAQLLRSLGEDPGEVRIRFFSHAPLRLGERPTRTRDIGVLGPALAGRASWTPRMLAHELTHAYTARWFEGSRHAPTLLAEGLATAVEGGRSFTPLRRDLAAATSAFPLEKALRARSLWKGNPVAKVRLAYLEGASLVLYVLDRWGLAALKRFVTAVSDSDLSRGGLDTATRRSLGIGWAELRSGWADFVQTLP